MWKLYHFLPFQRVDPRQQFRCQKNITLLIRALPLEYPTSHFSVSRIPSRMNGRNERREGAKREREQHKQKKEIEKIKGAIKIFSHLILEMYNK